MKGFWRWKFWTFRLVLYFSLSLLLLLVGMFRFSLVDVKCFSAWLWYLQIFSFKEVWFAIRGLLEAGVGLGKEICGIRRETLLIREIHSNIYSYWEQLGNKISAEEYLYFTLSWFPTNFAQLGQNNYLWHGIKHPTDALWGNWKWMSSNCVSFRDFRFCAFCNYRGTADTSPAFANWAEDWGGRGGG